MMKQGRATKYLILEALLLVCLFAVSIGIRIYNMPMESYGLGTFYDTASVESQKAVPYISGTGIHQVYLYMLRGLFLMFGNLWKVGTIAQLVLFFIGAVVFYFAIRKVCGSIGSLLIAVAMLCAPCFLPITYIYGPQMLYFLLFGVGLYYTHCLVADNAEREEVGILFILQVILNGLYAGLLIYLDLFSVILVLPIIFLPYFLRHGLGMLKGAGIAFLWVLSAAVCVITCGFVESMLAGVSIDSIMEQWFTYSFGQLFNKSSDVFMNWNSLVSDRHIWLGLFMTATYVATLVYFVVYLIFKRTTRTVRELNVEELLKNQLSEEETAQEQVAVLEEVTEKVNVSADMNADDKEIESVVQFIENPLPLPKKHVKKTLDYAFEPDFEDMDYDINNISEEDDYDLR